MGGSIALVSSSAYIGIGAGGSERGVAGARHQRKFRRGGSGFVQGSSSSSSAAGGAHHRCLVPAAKKPLERDDRKRDTILVFFFQPRHTTLKKKSQRRGTSRSSIVSEVVEGLSLHWVEMLKELSRKSGTLTSLLACLLELSCEVGEECPSAFCLCVLRLE